MECLARKHVTEAAIFSYTSRGILSTHFSIYDSTTVFLKHAALHTILTRGPSSG